jgi:putative hemolysin
MEDTAPEEYQTFLSNIFVSDVSDLSIISGFLILLTLIIASALISGSEIAFFSLNKATIDSIKGRNSTTIKWLWYRPEKLLATILISNNFVNVAIIIISTWLTNNLINFKSDWIMFLVDVVLITSILLLFGELMPKIMANIRPLDFSRRMAIPLKTLYHLFAPVCNTLVRSTTLIDKRVHRKGSNISKEDLSEAIDYSAKVSDQDEEETKLLKGIVSFGDKEVKEIMKSRMDLIALDENMDMKTVLASVQDAGFSRYPVYKDNLDSIIGILHIKDLLPYIESGQDIDWKKNLRQPYFIPENKRINDLLNEFQEKKVHLAIVVDEYGGTLGIITLEDVIEEIVGDISDEFDEDMDEKGIRVLRNGTVEIEGKLSIIDFCRFLDISENYFDDVKGDADTIAGLILEENEEFPETGNSIEILEYKFRIHEIDKRRIKKIRIEQ